MAYEGVLLGASVIKAIAAIPGAIKNIRDLLVKEKYSDADLLMELDNLRDYIASFGNTSGWLEEIKRLHEHLQRLDETLQEIKLQYNRSISQGRFIAMQYDLAKVRGTWEVAKNVNFLPLIAFFEQIHHIEKQPLVTNNEGKPVSGPSWAIRFLDLHTAIEEKILQYDNGDDTVVKDIANEFNSLLGHVRTNMFKADERIREEATALGIEFAKLAGNLKNA